MGNNNISHINGIKPNLLNNLNKFLNDLYKCFVGPKTLINGRLSNCVVVRYNLQ